MRAARPTGAPDVREQQRVRTGGIEVVLLDRNRREYLFDEECPTFLATPVGELDTDEKLGGRNRGDCDVVLVGDLPLERP